MIDANPGLGLPLMYHLVQQRVLDLLPCVPRDVTTADGDIERAAGPDLDCQLTQPGAHAAGEPDGDLTQGTGEVLRVQSLVQAGEPVQKNQITGASSFPRARPRPRWGMLLDRELEKLALGRAAQSTRNPAVE